MDALCQGPECSLYGLTFNAPPVHPRDYHRKTTIIAVMIYSPSDGGFSWPDDGPRQTPPEGVRDAPFQSVAWIALQLLTPPHPRPSRVLHLLSNSRRRDSSDGVELQGSGAHSDREQVGRGSLTPPAFSAESLQELGERTERRGEMSQRSLSLSPVSPSAGAAAVKENPGSQLAFRNLPHFIQTNTLCNHRWLLCNGGIYLFIFYLTVHSRYHLTHTMSCFKHSLQHFSWIVRTSRYGRRGGGVKVGRRPKSAQCVLFWHLRCVGVAAVPSHSVFARTKITCTPNRAVNGWLSVWWHRSGTARRSVCIFGLDAEDWTKWENEFYPEPLGGQSFSPRSVK